MPKQNPPKSTSGVAGEIPKGHTLRKTSRVNYNDAAMLELTDSDHVFNLQESVANSERAQAEATAVAQTFKAGVDVPKLQAPVNTWAVEGESLALLSKGFIVIRFQELLGKCNSNQQIFSAAIQHFELHNQFFVSSCNSAHLNGTADVVATYQAVKRAGDELFAPQFAYIIAVSKFRLLLANLLERLPITSDIRARNTALFNDLSREYEDRESAIRETMHNIYVKVGGEARKKLEAYMKAFKQRAEMLKWQQTKLEIWAKECLEELPKGYMDISVVTSTL